jgi:hypothetical protein
MEVGKNVSQRTGVYRGTPIGTCRPHAGGQLLLDFASLFRVSFRCSSLSCGRGVVAYPTLPPPTTHLAATLGTTPDSLRGIGHSLFYHPEATAKYIRDGIAQA